MKALFRLFPLAAGASRWFETRFTPLGKLLLGGLLAAGIFSSDSSQTQAYLLFASLAAPLLLAGVLCLFWQPRLRASRVLPRYVTAGEVARYTVAIANEGGAMERDLIAYDRLSGRRPAWTEMRDARAAHTLATDNWFDRRVGFMAWLRQCRALRGGDIDALALPPLPAGLITTVEIELRPTRRGQLRLGTLELARPDPLGLIFSRSYAASPDTVIALPKRYPIPLLDPRPPGSHRRDGTTLATVAGGASEFMALREYRPGDPQKHIHWRSFAKRRIPVVKQFSEDRGNKPILLLDTYCAAPDGRVFEALVATAASVVARPWRDPGTAFELVLVAVDKLIRIGGDDLRETLATQLEFLAELPPARADSFAARIGPLERELEPGLPVLFVTTGWDESRQRFAHGLALRQAASAAVLVVADEAPGAPPQRSIFIVRPATIAADLGRLRFLPTNVAGSSRVQTQR